MKRWFTHGFIAAYVGILLLGVASHGTQFRSNSHPLMYYIVWDMFCGWSAWEQRMHVIGEGESGTYYELAPGPWGDYHPYGDLSRQEYDPYLCHVVRLGLNTLQHTEHEPIQRMYVVEEVWAKKFNLPPDMRRRLNPVPDERRTHFQLRYVCAGDGTVRTEHPSWFEKQTKIALMSNPRLQQKADSTQPFVLASHADQ